MGIRSFQVSVRVKAQICEKCRENLPRSSLTSLSDGGR